MSFRYNIELNVNEISYNRGLLQFFPFDEQIELSFLTAGTVGGENSVMYNDRLEEGEDFFFKYGMNIGFSSKKIHRTEYKATDLADLFGWFGGIYSAIHSLFALFLSYYSELKFSISLNRSLDEKTEVVTKNDKCCKPGVVEFVSCGYSAYYLDSSNRLMTEIDEVQEKLKIDLIINSIKSLQE